MPAAPSTMQLTRTTLLLSTILLPLTTAQFLSDTSNGQLPQCGQQCAVLTSAQSSCGQSWSCFCQTVWTGSNGALTTMCATSCSTPSDNTLVSQWYTQNCGSDNGASEHGSSGGGGTSNTGGSSSPGSSSSPSSPSTTANEGLSASDGNSSGCGDWFGCHWKWVVMIIVLAVGLTALGIGGRIWKKRHDRKRDAITGGFNTGITERKGPAPPAASASQMSQTQDPNASGVLEPVTGRDSPARTREAFMPYGYGYTRSESRLASGGFERAQSPLARGATPVNELERGQGGIEEATPRKKRVLVRERSAEEEDVTR